MTTYVTARKKRVTLKYNLIGFNIKTNRLFKRKVAFSSPQVCFNCRKPGHGLTDCPEAVRDEEMGRDICYRCGSTEHDIRKCKAKVDPALGESSQLDFFDPSSCNPAVTNLLTLRGVPIC